MPLALLAAGQLYTAAFFHDRDALMPREGAIIFSDLIGKLDLIRVACDKCGRDGCYGLKRLIERPRPSVCWRPFRVTTAFPECALANYAA
jgi:hypothetical protein